MVSIDSETSDPEAFTQRWIAQSLNTKPLTDDDRSAVVDGIRRCYRAAGQDWPNLVVWVRSPSELATFVQTSQPLIRRSHRAMIRRAGRDARLREAGTYARWYGVRLALTLACAAVAAVMIFIVYRAVRHDFPASALEAWQVPVFGFIGFWASIFTVTTPLLAIDDFRDMQEARFAPIGGELATELQALLDPGRSAVGRDEQADKVGESVRGTLLPVWKSIWQGGSVLRGVSTTAETAPAIDREQVPVRGRGTIADLAFRQEQGTLTSDIPGDRALDALTGLVAARRAAGWTPYRGLVVICEPPRLLRTESAAERLQLHCATGPAVVWGDAAETKAYYLSGVRVPEKLVQPDVTVADIHRQSNSEVRRVAIERMGWPNYLQQGGFRLVASSADPGNPGRELRLYEVSAYFHRSRRLLLMVNGSPDRSGRQREYAEPVPDDLDDPIAAAAWQYGCSVDIYRQLARRT